MEIVYTVDVKMKNDGEDFKHILKMDVSCLNILSFSSSYLFPINQKYSQETSSSSQQHRTTKSSFCVYICPLEQPWNFTLITTSSLPVVQLVWNLDGTHLLICNEAGLCQIFKMKNDGINNMEHVYEYKIHEDILCAKYIFPRHAIVVDLYSNESFYEQGYQSSPLLNYALNSGNFICVTTSGIIHILPIDRSLSPINYYLSQNDPLSATLCDIFPTEKGFNISLSEHIEGALVHCFVVDYAALEPKVSLNSYRTRGFRIPSCYGKLESLFYFQRNGNACILTHLTSSTSDLIELYEYNLEHEEWISITVLNSSEKRITSISLPLNSLFVQDDAYQGLFGRQILFAFNDGSIASFDKLNLTNREQCFSTHNNDFDINQSDFLIRMQHTNSGSCCVGFTHNGNIALLRTISLNDVASLSSSMVRLLVYLFEQYIFQILYPFDIWDILCLISNNSIINQIVERLVADFEVQPLEFKRLHFVRFKECLYHLHRLACPFMLDSSEHLTSLLIYHALLITRDYLRLFSYEPANRNFVDAAQEILQQSSFVQHIDVKRIKYSGDHLIITDTNTIDPTHYQLISFTLLINWICDIVFYFIGYLQTQRVSPWSSCQNLFTDSRQLQWLREFMIYIYILNRTNKIPCSKIADLALFHQQQPTQSNEQKDILKDIYHSLTKFSQRIEVQKVNIFDENFLEDWSAFSVELLQSTTENIFPQSYPFLIPNSLVPQKFIRDRLPSFATHLYGNSPQTNNVADTQFDIITLGKMSLSSNPTHRRCLRCSNFSRILTSKPYPLLFYRLNNRCLCGGLFYIYSESNTSERIK
ncbi:unnamed protein product [Rotaria socialis]|uniref:Mediator of RNA polymerase II transcription subunit 16 central helical bridge domain-containing protein n=1 Tax=Rotaria socialis TaxID=392032 RepID=A0A820UWT3_9BILA|nr:unnamed protein product [Rotaria socialis]CAF4491262.1 unnamed protein product [Rotaria socialis]